MATHRPRSPVLAALLSGLVPGLGQLYCREWGKGAAYLVATTLVDAAAGVSRGLLEIVTTRALPESPGPLLVGAAIMAALATASVLGAIRSARA
ncbi:MAG: hypothetical protein U0900_06720 [Myxococcota bacterium]